MTRRNNCGDVPAGHPRSLPASLVRRTAGAALAAVTLLLGVAGCGGGDASGATVDVYVAAPMCAGAKAELKAHGPAAGHYRIAVRCLASTEAAGGTLDLAANGANSRRATSDTSAVATLEPPGPGNKFARSILGSAGVPLVLDPSARRGMKRIIEAVEGAGSSSVRDEVREALEPS